MGKARFDFKTFITGNFGAEFSPKGWAWKAPNFTFGTFENDILNGTDKRDYVRGFWGDDELYLGGGHDRGYGGRGNDKIYLGDGNDRGYGGRGNDLVAGEGGNDKLFGGGGFDTALFSGSILDYSWSGFGSSNGRKKGVITDTNTSDGDNGTDRLFRFEALQFDDFTYLIGQNNAPLVLATDQSTAENVAVGFAISTYDLDGDTLVLDSFSVTGTGSLTTAGPDTVLSPLMGTGIAFNFSFDPGAGYLYLNSGETVVETVTVTVSDDNGGTSVVTFDLTINGVNDPPEANDSSNTGNEDTVISGTVTASDADGDPLTFSLDTDASNGAVTVNPDGSYDYTPNEDYNGPDSFTYLVDDNNGGTDTGTVTLTVTPVNDAPVAADSSAAGNEDTIISATVSATDIDSPLLTFSLDTDASNGAVTVNPDGSYDYTPNEDYNGPDSFTYLVDDNNGGTDTGTVTLTVIPVNDAPVAPDTAVTVDEDGVLSDAVVATDADGDGLIYTLDSGTGNGTLVFNDDGSFTYTPDENYFGPDSFTYAVDDGNDGNDTGTVSITVNSVNDAPALVGDGTEENLPLLAGFSVTANEADGPIIIDLNPFVADLETANLDFSLLSIVNQDDGRGIRIPVTVENGILTLNPSDFGLDAGETLNAAVTFTADDGSGAANATLNGIFDLTVEGSDLGTPVNTNTAPVAQDASVVEGDQAPILIDLNLLVSDADSDPLTIENVTIVGGGRNPAVFSLAAGVLTLDPAQFNLPDGGALDLEIQYTVNDGSNAVNNTGSGAVYLTVVEGPDPDTPDEEPNIAPDAPSETLNIDYAFGQNILIDLANIASDADGDDLIFTVSTSGGTDLSAGISDSVVVIPWTDADLLGLGSGDSVQTELTYTVDDGSGAANAIATGTVTVNVTKPLNTAPIATETNQNVQVTDGSFEINLNNLVSDFDAGDVLTLSGVGLTFEGSAVTDPLIFSFDAGTGIVTIDPTALGIAEASIVQGELTFSVDDGSGASNSSDTGSVALAFQSNYAPVALETEQDVNVEDGIFTISITPVNPDFLLPPLISDANGDALTVSNVALTLGGAPITVDFDAVTGIVTIDPVDFGLLDGASDTALLTFDVDDGTGTANSSDSGSVTLNLTDPLDTGGSVVLDFEAFSSDSGLSIPIGGTSTQGFFFAGSAIVIETDEGGSRLAPGLAEGQTTTGGDNVLAAGAESGDTFAFYASEDTPYLIGSDPLTTFSSFNPAGLSGPEVLELLGQEGDNFDLEGLSLNGLGNADTATITAYGLQVTETPSSVAGFSGYTVELVEIDSFDFAIDPSTAATQIDFNDPTYGGAFDDIYAVGIETAGGSNFVLDDLLMTV